MDYFFLNKNIDANTPIFRYLDIDSFLQILNGEFYVSKKRQFVDKVDAGKNILFKEIGTNFLRNVEDENAIPRKPFSMTDFLDFLHTSQEYLTSCWTKNEDDFLMWSAYTQSNCGVCLQSTINNVVASFTSVENYSIWCSPMYYDGFINIGTLEEILFRKQHMYINENEVRFYFLSTALGESMDHGAGKRVFGANLKVKPDVMIDKVILSPKMRGNSSGVLSQLLEEKYPFLKDRVVKSKINIDR